MSPPDEREPGEPRLPANDSLKGLADALDEIAAQPFEDDSDFSEAQRAGFKGRADSQVPEQKGESRRGG